MHENLCRLTGAETKEDAEMRKIAVLAMVMVFVGTTGVFAGGQGEESDAAEGSDAAEQAESGEIVLDFFQFKPDLDDAYKDLAREFEEQHDDVIVAVETRGGGEQWQTIIQSRFATGGGPNIFPVEGEGQYEEWSDFIADLSDEPWVETAIPSALTGLQIDGSQMGMPKAFEGYGYIYNQDMFDDAGIDEVPTTLSELEAAAQQLQEAGYQPFATGYGTWWVMGLHLLNIPFANQPDPEGFIEGLNEGSESMADNALFQDLGDLIDLTVEYGESNPLTTDHNQQVQLFADEEVAMIQQGVWKEIPIFEANPDINVGVTPMPLNDEDEFDHLAVGVPFYFAVNSQASEREQEMSREFLEFMVMSDTGQEYLTDRFSFIPTYEDVPSGGLGGVASAILEYTAEDRTIPWVFGQFPAGFPDDAASAIQAYVAEERDWDATLERLDEAWQNRSE